MITKLDNSDANVHPFFLSPLRRVLNSYQYKLNVNRSDDSSASGVSVKTPNNPFAVEVKSGFSREDTVTLSKDLNPSPNESRFRNDLGGVMRNSLRYLQNKRIREEEGKERSEEQDLEELKKAVLSPLGIREEDIKDVSINVNFNVERNLVEGENIQENAGESSGDPTSQKKMLETKGVVFIQVDGELKDGRKFHISHGYDAKITEDLEKISSNGVIDEEELDKKIVLGSDFGGFVMDLNGDGIEDSKGGGFTYDGGFINFYGANFEDIYTSDKNVGRIADEVVGKFKNFNTSMEEDLFANKPDLKAKALNSLKENIDSIYNMYNYQLNLLSLNRYI